MFKKYILATSIVTIFFMTGTVRAEKKQDFTFKPIDSSANSVNWDTAAPWKLPKGFTQTIVSDENSLNIYDGGRTDWPDMNTVNETGPMAGRFLYRTHEIRYPVNQPEGGTVSVVDLETGSTTILAQDPAYNALDGIRWSPWGTILFAEEVSGGRFFELELNNDLVTAKAIHDRPAVGRLKHEGIDFDDQGNIYLVDEHLGRSIGCSGVVPCVCLCPL